MLVLTGSQAFLRQVITSDGQDPDPKDFTFLGTPEEVFNFVDSFKTDKTGRRVAGIVHRDEKRYMDIEFTPTPKGQRLSMTAENAFEGSPAKLYIDLVKSDPKAKHITLFGTKFMYPSHDGLYAMRLTQRYHGKTFSKVKRELQMLTIVGARLNAHYQPFLNAVKEKGFESTTNIRPQDFYSEVVPPQYEYPLVMNAFGAEGEATFYAAPRSLQVLAMTDDITRRALLYSQIPYKGLILAQDSYMLALQSAATVSTEGWIRDFIYNNFDLLSKMYDDRYVSNFWAEVESGAIKAV